VFRDYSDGRISLPNHVADFLEKLLCLDGIFCTLNCAVNTTGMNHLNDSPKYVYVHCSLAICYPMIAQITAKIVKTHQLLKLDCTGTIVFTKAFQRPVS